MSWTIAATSVDSKELSMLRSAISDAKENNILMFCSTSDQGSISSGNCIPGAWSDSCIRIGAATNLGDKCTWVPEEFDFLLPGKDIPFKWKRPDGILSWYESGSSLATAIGAGLCGLLLYCDRVVNERNPRYQSRSEIVKLFTRMAATSKNKFPRADIWFDEKYRQDRQNRLSESLAENNAHNQKRMMRDEAFDSLEPKVPKQLFETAWDDLSLETLKGLLEDMERKLV